MFKSAFYPVRPDNGRQRSLQLRAALERLVDELIAYLDVVDGDADLEPEPIEDNADREREECP